MSALLRADWIRFRRRRDLWAIAIGVLVISATGFLYGYKQDVTDPPQMTADEVRQMVADPFFYGADPDLPLSAAQVDEIVAQQLADQRAQQVEWDAGQLVTLQKYDLAQSPMTIIGFGILPLIALLIGATLIVGDEFRFGTVRTSLIAASPRRPFLVARLVTIAAMSVGLYAAVAILGVALSAALHLVGAELPPASLAPDPVASVATVLAEILSGFALLALAISLTVLVRSGAIPILLVLLAVVTDAFVTNLPIFLAGEPLARISQLSLTTSIRTVVSALASSTGALTFANLDATVSPTAIPTWAGALVILAWLGLFLALADRRFRTMDIVE